MFFIFISCNLLNVMTNTVIKCDSVYKIFGANAKKMLQEANGNVDAKTFQENGCIVGVNNASFEVSNEKC